MSEADNSMALMLGEIRGEVRQVVDHVATLAGKIDALTASLHQMAHLPAEMQALKDRVAILEAAEQQRRGAMGLGAIIIKVAPWIGPIAVTVGAAVITVKGLGQ